MAQRTDITRIDFQANARGANAAIESIRVKAEECNTKVTKLKEELKLGINANLPADQIERLRQNLASARKEANQFNTAYKELVKGMRTLDQGIKAFNDGSLSQMSAAFQKAVNNAAKLTIARLNPMSETYKKDKEQLIALKDASQQYYARLQADSAMVIKTIQQGGKVSRQAINEELTAHRELLSVLSEDDAGYKRTVQNIAILEQHQRAMGGNYAYIRQNMSDTRKVSDQTLASMLAELQKVNQEGRVSQKILNENATMMREIRAEQGRRVQNVLGGDLSKQNEGNIRQAIATAKELLSTYKTGSKQAQALSAQIVNAEEHLKTTGVEGQRAARKQAEAAQLLADKYKMMSDRMSNLKVLSQGALTETQKFWQAQMDGALRGSKAYKEAEKNLKLIAAEQQRQTQMQLQQQAAKIAPTKAGQYRLGALSEQELQTSIAAAKQLASAMKTTDPAYKQLVDNILRAEEHMKQFGLEGQRSARQTAEQLKQMEARMGNVKSLSNAALEETRRFWQAQMDGAQRGSKAYKEAEANVKALTAEQQRLATEQAKTQANRLMGGTAALSSMGAGEIQKAIEAAKQYQLTLKADSQAYKDLSVAIVNAEEHVKKYGVEAERAARREIEATKKAADERRKTDQLMRDQLQQGTSLSKTALKAQESYWQRLIDDPKTAATSLQEYKARLQEVQDLQRMQKREIGNNIMSQFQRDPNLADRLSADKLKEYTDALKAYRDTLPKQGNADRIKEIDEVLQKCGVSAKKAAEQAMSLRQAVTIGQQVRNGGFKGTTDELTRAKKVLEDLQQRVEKGGRSWQKLQRDINNINLELKRVDTVSKEVQAVLDQPKGRSFNELKQAVEQGRLKLQSMDRTTKEGQKAFDELAKKIKACDLEMKTLGNSAKGTVSAFDKSWSRLKTYVGLYVGAAVAMQKLTGTLHDLMELSDKMGEVRKTTGFTADEVGRLSANLKKMDVRTSLVSLLDISASAGQLGLKTIEDVQGFTEAANKLMIALPEMGKEAATEMMRVAIATGEVEKIRKQLQEGTIEGSSATAVAMEKIASTIDRLRASSASTAPEITDFVKRVGAVGAQSGITIDQVAALGSTVSSLGMRVEMSATALSRMIPAIRRNAFDVAKAIGMAPEALRQMFDEAGGGMNAMLAIFQHIKDSGMNEDSIEKMLGMGDMAEVMKELNQQGARAGIVFAGLSQNVDELRRQLGTASQAYEENVAIQQEFERMNETLPAKWERLKNQLEEYFIGGEAQSWLGDIIDGLRTIINLITGPLSGAFNAFLLSFGAFKLGFGAMGWKFIIGPIWETINGTRQLGVSITALKTKWIAAWKAMDAATKTNWIVAIGFALWQLGSAIWDAVTKVSALDKALAELDNETDDAVRHVGRLVTAFNDASAKADTAAKKHEQLKNETEKLRKEVDELKKSTDNSTAAHDKLKKKEDELEQAEKELKKASDESNKANQTRSNLISEINSKYSTYLGYMLNEKTAAEQVASAHQLIIAALKEERKQKGLNAMHNAIDQEYAEDLKEYTEDSQSNLKDISRSAQRRIMDQWRRVLTAVTPDADNGTYSMAAVQGVTKGGTYRSEEELKRAMRSALREIIKTEAADVSGNVSVSTWAGRGIKSVDTFLNDIWGNRFDDGFGDWAETYIKRESAIMQATHDNQVEVDQAHQETIQKAVADQQSNLKSLQQISQKNQKFTDDQIRSMAQSVNALVAGFDRYGEELSGADNVFGKGNEQTLENAVNNVLANLDQATRARVLRVAQKGKKNGTGNISTTTTTPWGNTPAADSTDYSTWDVNELVARRNQMDKFKNVLKDGVDVKTVLAEDKALMKALQNGLSDDWHSVLEWYNTERLKIQQELKSERHSTNTGHWRDDPKTKKRSNPLVESDYALAELDRYYARRKELLEKAREEENMSEELYNRQVELLEQEHLKKRSDLRRTFTADNSKEEQAMVKQFREWWSALEKSGDLDEVPWATVESEWAKATAAQIGRNNLKAQQDLTQLQSITVKHLNAIAKLVDKERPYDGITANLRDNLTKMDILLADMVEQGPTADTAKLMREQTQRLKFLLGEAENAYSLTFDDIKKKAEEQGWGDWIKALEVDEQKKQSLMQNLRNVYDQIQEAIKKESSIIKKQLEIQWNDLLPGSDMSMKGVFEKAISDLGLEGDRVKRANSLIGAGAASERVADRLAIKQMQVQLDMQQTYFALMQKIGDERVRQLQLSAKANEQAAKELRLKEQQLRAEGKTAEAEVMALKAQNAERQALQDSFDAEHAQKSLNLAKTKELAEEEKQRVAIANQLEESQNRLYTSLREWADLLASSVQSLFEAEHAGDAEYYNERAKLDLTGKGGPGAGTYIVIDNEGTSDAKAHYEYLDERQALERQHEIEQENARAEAWKKVMDEFNQKMADSITDWANAYMQNKATEDNTAELKSLQGKLGEQEATLNMSIVAENQNTEALKGLTGKLAEGITIKKDDNGGSEFAADKQANYPSSSQQPATTPGIDFATDKAMNYPSGGDQANTDATVANTQALNTLTQTMGGQVPESADITGDFASDKQANYPSGGGEISPAAQQKINDQNAVTENAINNKQKEVTTSVQGDKKIAQSNQSTFAKMIQATNLYGVAYAAMSNDNMDMAQKFEMIALQAVGNAAIAGLQVALSQSTAQTAANMPAAASRASAEEGPIAGPILFAVLSALVGGLMGIAASKIAKSKSQISQITGASVGAGRLATGMLTYASGNINEFSDPNSLTPGRSYNVDAADGRTYRAKYTGTNPKTHITNGAEFHLVGERGREAIIDAHTTRLLQMDDTGIWQSIQTLYNGGRISSGFGQRRRGRGVRAFAEGNIDEFEDAMGGYDIATDSTGGGMSMEMAVALQASLDRQSDLLERALTDGIHAKFDVYGKGGLIDSYDTGKKTVNRHGERY